MLVEMENVEKKLNVIAKNTNPKQSFLLTFSGKGASLEHVFEPEISVNDGCHYEIAFTSLDTSYSMPNIDLSNNNFKVGRIGTPLTEITVDPGCYGMMHLNKEISRLLESLGMPKAVKFSANYNTFKCNMIVSAGYMVNFTEHSMRRVFGFKANKYEAVTQKRFVSDYKVQILPINSILVQCNLVGNSYLNGVLAPIVHTFFPRADPGDKIIETPVEYIYLPVASDIIRRISVWLTDQEGNLLNLTEEFVTIRFHLRSC